MGKKRKQDQGRDDSSSSDGKQCHCQIVDISRPSDGIRDAVIELKNIIQVKVSTEEKFKMKLEKLKEKRKKDKTKHGEVIRILKEDLRILKEDHQELKLKIQEMRKEGCAEVNHYKASSSHRSQLRQSTRFRLVIENSVSKTIYKKETVETQDGGGYIKVVMYDGGNPIASDHPLASVKVDLVVIEGWFNEPKRDSWSKEEFEESIIKPRKGISRLVMNDTFRLIDGICDHEGAIIMDNSQQREVKLGARIAVHTEIRVLEGVSNSFKVQEGKTKKMAPNKRVKKPSLPVPTRNVEQPTITHATRHGEYLVSPDYVFSTRVSTEEQHSVTPPVVQGVLQKAEDNRPSYPPTTVPLMAERNGQTLNGSSQQSSQQIPTQILWQSTSAHSTQHGQDYSLPPSSIQNSLLAAGYCPDNQPLPVCRKDQYASFPNASSQLEFPMVSAYGSLNGILQWISNPQGEIPVEDERHLNVQTQIQGSYESYRCGQVLLQWDKPHVELKNHWNLLDQFMPLYSTQSMFYSERRLTDKAHKLACFASGDSFLKMIVSLKSRATQTPQRRGILIRPIESYDSHDGTPVKKQRNAKYQLRFINRVCNVYYTRNQINSDDGDLLKVALYDENNLVVTSGPLSSAFVEVVLLHGDFNAEGQDYWTSEEYNACLMNPRSVKGPPALGGNLVLALTDGEAELGNIHFKISSFHARTRKFKMGVEIKNVRDESVQEGITSPFIVRVHAAEASVCQRIKTIEAMIRVETQKIKMYEEALERMECAARERLHVTSVSSVLGASSVEDHDSMVRSASDRPLESSHLGFQCSAASTFQAERDGSFFTRQREEIKDAHDFATTVAEPSSSVSVREPRARNVPIFSINGRSIDD